MRRPCRGLAGQSQSAVCAGHRAFPDAPKRWLRPDRLTHRRVLKIAVPIVLSNATVPILGAVDTGVVGQMGLAAPIGAVGIGAVIISASTGFRLSQDGNNRSDEPGPGPWRTARSVGASDAGAADRRRRRAGDGSSATAALLVAFKVAPASAEVESLARDYLAIRVWSAPATIALFGITGWLIALERTGPFWCCSSG